MLIMEANNKIVFKTHLSSFLLLVGLPDRDLRVLVLLLDLLLSRLLDLRLSLLLERLKNNRTNKSLKQKVSISLLQHF